MGAHFSVFDAAVDPAQPLADTVLEHKLSMACKSCVAVHLALDPTTGNQVTSC